MACPPKTYEEDNWDKLSPAFRDEHNRLRKARGQPPIPPPVIDRYVKPKAVELRAPSVEDKKEAMAELGGQLPDGGSLKLWKGIAASLALENAGLQLKGRKVGTCNLYHAIAKFVEVAEQESGWPRKKIIYEAERLFGVKDRTVATAIAYEKKLWRKWPRLVKEKIELENDRVAVKVYTGRATPTGDTGPYHGKLKRVTR